LQQKQKSFKDRRFQDILGNMSAEKKNANLALRSTWGGSRCGAGRRKNLLTVEHESRPEIKGRQIPIEISIHLRSGFAPMNGQRMIRTFMKATLRARRFGLRILHYRIYKKKLLLLCEFKTRKELEHAFKSLNTTLAIALKRRYESKHKKNHRGPVLLDRYKMLRLDSPLLLKNSLKNMLVRERYLDSGKILFIAAPIQASSSAFFNKWEQLLNLKRAINTVWNINRKAQTSKKAEHSVLAKTILSTPQFKLSQFGWHAWI